MKYSKTYKTISEYKKNSGEIITSNISIPNIYNRVIVLSTLNTGANPHENNIIEISCMEMMGGKLTGYEFDAYLHPRYAINEVTKQKTNLNNNFYEEFFESVYSSDKNVLVQFKKFVNQSKIIIFNTIKEIDFINNELNFQKIGTFQKNKFCSLFNIFKQMFPQANQNIISLTKCCEFLEIRLPKEKTHTSKNDCFALCKILSKLYDIINNSEQKIEKNISDKNENNTSEKKEINLGKNINGKITPISLNSTSKNNSRNSDNEFDYSDSLIDIIEEENRNTDENVSENIVLNNLGGKNNKLDLNDNKKNDIIFLNNKRKAKLDDLVNNLKNKVSPYKIEDDLQINFDPNELNFEK
jgi:DNA polymerase III epsilon subunit-like protein